MSNATKDTPKHTAPASHGNKPTEQPQKPTEQPKEEGKKEEGSTVFKSADAAQKHADAKNAEPLKQGQESRVPFKVYKVSDKSGNTLFGVAQNPAYALNAVREALGIKIEAVSGDAILPPEAYLARLTPEQLEAARKFLGSKG